MLLSLYVPVAKNCTSVLAAMVGFAGVTAIDTRAGVTVTATDPLMAPTFADTEHWPLPCAVSIPPTTVAMLGLLEVHVAVAVTSFVLPSLYEAVAVSCWVWPAVTLALKPLTWMVRRVGPLFTVGEDPPLPPQAVSAKRIQADRQMTAFLMFPPTKRTTLLSPKAKGTPIGRNECPWYQILTSSYTCQYTLVEQGPAH